jgi:hypothetical protein
MKVLSKLDVSILKCCLFICDYRLLSLTMKGNKQCLWIPALFSCPLYQPFISLFCPWIAVVATLHSPFQHGLLFSNILTFVLPLTCIRTPGNSFRFSHLYILRCYLRICVECWPSKSPVSCLFYLSCPPNAPPHSRPSVTFRNIDFMNVSDYYLEAASSIHNLRTPCAAVTLVPLDISSLTVIFRWPHYSVQRYKITEQQWTTRVTWVPLLWIT